MTLEKYCKGIKKDKCPEECEFKSEDIEPAIVSPPDEIAGIIISQNPTIRWWHFYRYVKNISHEDIRRKMLFSSVIPLSLINRILEFMGEKITDNDERCLFEVMFQNVYWTHLHKCFTDEQRSLKFKPKNATECANQWLKGELDSIVDDKTKFIIALGNHARKWVKKWQEKCEKGKEVEIINLPHPSGLTRKWNNKGDKCILEAIERLISLCKTIT